MEHKAPLVKEHRPPAPTGAVGDCPIALSARSLTMTTDPSPPRRKWHLQRWLLLLAAGFLAYGGWTQYAFRAALKEADALGWVVFYTDPVEQIRMNWKAAFKKRTWLNGVTLVHIDTSEKFQQHLAIVHRLNPHGLRIDNAATLRDLSALKALTRLQVVGLGGCTGLTNVDALKNLTALQQLGLYDCKALTNVDALKNLSALQFVFLTGCTGLTNVDALKNITALQQLGLYDCMALTNVDALKNLSSLKTVLLNGCKGLTNVDGLKNLAALETVQLGNCTMLTYESVASLKAALPNTQITGP